MCQPPAQQQRSRSHLLLSLTLAGLGLWLLFQLTQPARADDPAIPDAPGSISGMVTDATGAPLAGMDVTLYSPGSYPDYWFAGRIVRTDSAGAYRIGLLPAGIYRVGFSDPAQRLADNYYNNAATVQQATDVPIAGTNRTGINGVLTAGSMITGIVTFPASAQLAYPGDAGHLRVYRKIRGQWRDVKTVPLASSLPTVTFALGGLSAGVYRLCVFSGPFVGSTQAWNECYDNVATGVAQASDIVLGVGETRPNINFILGDGANLAQLGGHVTAATGTRLSNIAVTLFVSFTNAYGNFWHSAAFTQTNPAGEYYFRDLEPGAYALFFADPQGNYVSEFFDNLPTLIEFAVPTTTTWIRLAPYEIRINTHVTLTPASHILGDVTVVGEGPPAQADVQLFQKQAATWQFIRNWSTDSSGRFKIGGLLPGSYKISANTRVGEAFYGGYYGGANLEEATVITLTEAISHTNAHIDMTSFNSITPYANAIRGRVTAQGQPVPNIQVTAYANYSYPSAEPQVYVFTDAEGRYLLDGLQFSRYILSFSDPGGTYATTWYSSRGQPVYWPGENVDLFPTTTVSNINAALVPGGGIKGTVFVRDPSVLPHIVVQLFAKLGDSFWEINPRARVDENGAYALPGLLPGTYRLCFQENSGRYRDECYGAPPDQNYSFAAFDLVVKAGETLTSVNQLLGPRLYIYLPFAARH